MTFAKPQFLLLGAILLPLIALFYLWAREYRLRALKQLGEKQLIDRLSININHRGRRWRTALRLAGVALIVVSLARPQWGTVVSEIEQEGLQVMVALDVSQSMLAQDIKPSRLERAKLEILDLMERLDGDEIGLVLFSGASFIQVPLTSDYTTASTYLESADPGVISRPGTVIGEAIRTAAGGFDLNLSSQKVLVLMTDGEDSETDPVAAAREAAADDILIYTIGFGTTEGEPIPELNPHGELTGYIQDDRGETVLSKLDEQTLQEIANTAEGRYYRASAGGDELDNLLAEIDQLQKAQLENRFEIRHVERFQIFLMMGAIALIISELIPDRRTMKPAFALWEHIRPWNRNSRGEVVGSVSRRTPFEQVK